MWDWKTQLREQVWDNEHVLKVRQKFSELDAQTQSYVLLGSFGVFALILLLTFFGLWFRTIAIKNDLIAKDQDIRYVQSAAVRIEELNAQARSQDGEPLLRNFDNSGPAAPFAERVAQKSLIPKSNVEVTDAKNGMAELKLNKISLTQLMRVLFLIERSGSGASVEKLSVDSKDDPEGYLWAQLTVKKAGP